MKTLEEKLLERTKKSKKGCWVWFGGSRGNGYGAIKHNGKVIDTHRVSYMLYKGKIPKGLLICHSCDNPKCVNPDHLFLGTHKDNMQDCLKKGRMVIPEGQKYEKGQKPPNRKLTDRKVLKVKKDILKFYPSISLRQIAEKNKISYYTIRDIRRNKVYFN